MGVHELPEPADERPLGLVRLGVDRLLIDEHRAEQRGQREIGRGAFERRIRRLGAEPLFDRTFFDPECKWVPCKSPGDGHAPV